MSAGCSNCAKDDSGTGSQNGHAGQRQLVRVELRPPDPLAKGVPKACFVLKGVLSSAECEALIKQSETTGYDAALINTSGGQVMDTSVRNSGRVIMDDATTARDWFSRIASHLPSSIGDRKLVGLNERLRYLRYHPGQYFAPHQDGSYARPDRTESSLLTLMLYLNTSETARLAAGTRGATKAEFDGGETNFLDWRDEDIKVSVHPEVGDILIFDHRLLHEGAEVTRGVKYAVRTDVMYTIPSG